MGQMTVILASRSDLSRPLREQPSIWPPMQPEHEANLNPKIPHQHQNGPDPVIQNSFWQRMINTPAIPEPFSPGLAFPSRASTAIVLRPIPMARWEKLSTWSW
jgi:hypothetical protein